MSDLADGYYEICVGQTEGKFERFPIFFNHSTIFDQFKIKKEREKWLKWAQNHGIPSREKALNIAISNSKWSEAQEKALNLNSSDYKNFWSKRGKGKFISFDAIRQFHKVSDEMLGEVESMQAMKMMAIGQTDESFANSKSLDYEIFFLSRSEDGSPRFVAEEFDYFSETRLSILRDEYYSKVLNFDEEFFKKLSVTQFFYSLFDNCAHSPSDFFRKAICDLTVFQTRLLENGKYMNGIVKHCGNNVPADFYENPELLITLAMLRQHGDSNSEATSDFNEISADVASKGKNR